jgi:hypothetical protein
VIPLTTATGVEITIAQGQEITSSVRPRTNHVVNEAPRARGGTTISATARIVTAGV